MNYEYENTLTLFGCVKFRLFFVILKIMNQPKTNDSFEASLANITHQSKN